VKVFEYFGSRGLEPGQVRDLVATATGLEFAVRHSSYIGEYYQAGHPGGDAVVRIRPNELEDEDGTFPQWDEFADFKTVVEVRQIVASADETADFLDDLRRKLAMTEDLEFLRRS
jgi:hypothetical protein